MDIRHSSPARANSCDQAPTNSTHSLPEPGPPVRRIIAEKPTDILRQATKKRGPHRTATTTSRPTRTKSPWLAGVENHDVNSRNIRVEDRGLEPLTFWLPD